MASYEEKIADAFRMSDRVWARHANPWSVWTRYACLPLIVLTIWSRVWLGWWALVPLCLALLWTWLNPRLFSPPVSTKNWASKAVLGERVWLNRTQVPIPTHHQPLLLITQLISLTGLGPLIWGLIRLEVWPTLLGIALVILGKSWFLDRMVWLFEEMKTVEPRYGTWLY